MAFCACTLRALLTKVMWKRVATITARLVHTGISPLFLFVAMDFPKAASTCKSLSDLRSMCAGEGPSLPMDWYSMNKYIFCVCWSGAEEGACSTVAGRREEEEKQYRLKSRGTQHATNTTKIRGSWSAHLFSEFEALRSANGGFLVLSSSEISALQARERGTICVCRRTVLVALARRRTA